MDLISGSVDQSSSPQAKITLFRSLFRGREDVYPRRFESRKTGRSGYAPACANEWVRGVCEKPRIKCAECRNRRFLPVTNDVIRWHLSGCDAEGQPFVAGVYPLLLDETCFFLAVDFDKADWREDAAAFFETCRHLNIPVAIERSRSGRGAHAWFFFEEAIPAALSRRLGSHLLTETMERRPDVGLDSYDRLFPNQDTMPQGGFGNPIALPLQRSARQQDNTVFLDGAFVPWTDQWAFLASVRKIRRPQVEEIVEDAERRGRILGVRLPPQDDGETEPWQSAADLATALRWAAEGATAFVPAAPQPAWRRMYVAGAVAALAGVALASGALFGWRYASSGTAPVPTVRFEVPPPAGVTLRPSPVASAAQLALSPDGRHLAFIAATRRGPSQIWIRPLDSVQAQPLAGTEGASFPFWSPDGRFLAFFAAGKLKRSTPGAAPPRRWQTPRLVAAGHGAGTT